MEYIQHTYYQLYEASLELIMLIYAQFVIKKRNEKVWQLQLFFFNMIF